VIHLNQGCQTQIHIGPKWKIWSKTRASVDIYWKIIFNIRSVLPVWRHKHYRVLSWLTHLNTSRALWNLMFQWYMRYIIPTDQR